MRTLLIGILGATLVAAAPGLVSADQRPGSGGGGQRTPPAGGQRSPARPMPAPRQPDVREGHQSAQRVEQRAHDLERHAARGSLETMTRDRDRIQQRVQEMDKAQDRWREGLGELDRLRVQDRLRDMDQQRERLRTHLSDLDGALAAPDVDRNRIQELAREINLETEQWRMTWRDAAQGAPAAPLR